MFVPEVWRRMSPPILKSRFHRMNDSTFVRAKATDVTGTTFHTLGINGVVLLQFWFWQRRNQYFSPKSQLCIIPWKLRERYSFIFYYETPYVESRQIKVLIYRQDYVESCQIKVLIYRQDCGGTIIKTIKIQEHADTPHAPTPDSGKSIISLRNKPQYICIGIYVSKASEQVPWTRVRIPSPQPLLEVI